MGRHACGANEYTEPLVPGGNAKFLGLGRSPVCRIYVYLIGYAKGAQRVQRLAHNGQVAVAAHENANFFHRIPPYKMKKGTLTAYSKCAQTAGKQSKRPAPLWCSTSSVSHRAFTILTHTVYHIPAWSSNGKCSESQPPIPAFPVHCAKIETNISISQPRQKRPAPTLTQHLANLFVGADPCVRPAETQHVFLPFSANS